MKVGILTHHWLANFGANLQALATARALRQLGCEPIIIDYRLPVLEALYRKRVSLDQLQTHEAFCQEYLPLSEVCTSTEEVISVAKSHRLDAVISGSDAVLRLDSKSDREDLTFPNAFWLDWCNEAGIAHTGFIAPSAMGSKYYQLSGRTRRGIRLACQKLDYISTRDRWTQWMLRLCGVPNRAIHYCPDPTSVLPSLLSSAELKVPEESPPYIIVSLYEDTRPSTWIDDLVSSAHASGYKVFSLPHPEGETRGNFDRILGLPMSPLEWVQWLANASGYVGVRFHPIMLSMVLGVPFVALDTYDVGLKWAGSKLKRKLRHRLNPHTRVMSKTFDLCARAGRERYAFPTYRFNQATPALIMQMLQEQRENPLPSHFYQQRHDLFYKALKTAVGHLSTAD
ncbi:MAG: polysaccharide pyruvyl transferase family protein [Verrucomicrobiota bacterium JB022]|nr:polysaccharide pyruvyl transferase family protein [Verrucomicrobiota bacterium JB022]